MSDDPNGFVAVLRIELHFPDAASLKARRRELAPVKAQVVRLGGAVCEVGHHDRWQRATVLAAFLAGAPGRLEEVADRLEGWLDARFPHGISVHRSVTSWRDLVG